MFTLPLPEKKQHRQHYAKNNTPAQLKSWLEEYLSSNQFSCVLQSKLKSFLHLFEKDKKEGSKKDSEVFLSEVPSFISNMIMLDSDDAERKGELLFFIFSTLLAQHTRWKTASIEAKYDAMLENFWKENLSEHYAGLTDFLKFRLIFHVVAFGSGSLKIKIEVINTITGNDFIPCLINQDHKVVKVFFDALSKNIRSHQAGRDDLIRLICDKILSPFLNLSEDQVSLVEKKDFLDVCRQSLALIKQDKRVGMTTHAFVSNILAHAVFESFDDKESDEKLIVKEAATSATTKKHMLEPDLSIEEIISKIFSCFPDVKTLFEEDFRAAHPNAFMLIYYHIDSFSVSRSVWREVRKILKKYHKYLFQSKYLSLDQNLEMLPIYSFILIRVLLILDFFLAEKDYLAEKLLIIRAIILNAIVVCARQREDSHELQLIAERRWSDLNEYMSLAGRPLQEIIEEDDFNIKNEEKNLDESLHYQSLRKLHKARQAYMKKQYYDDKFFHLSFFLPHIKNVFVQIEEFGIYQNMSSLLDVFHGQRVEAWLAIGRVLLQIEGHKSLVSHFDESFDQDEAEDIEKILFQIEIICSAYDSKNKAKLEDISNINSRVAVLNFLLSVSEILQHKKYLRELIEIKYQALGREREALSFDENIMEKRAFCFPMFALPETYDRRPESHRKRSGVFEDVPQESKFKKTFFSESIGMHSCLKKISNASAACENVSTHKEVQTIVNEILALDKQFPSDGLRVFLDVDKKSMAQSVVDEVATKLVKVYQDHEPFESFDRAEGVFVRAIMQLSFQLDAFCQNYGLNSQALQQLSSSRRDESVLFESGPRK